MRKKTLQRIRERQAAYAVEQLEPAIAQIPENAFDAECSACGKTFCLLSSVGVFGDRDADGLMFEGEPICYDCLDLKFEKQ